MQGVKLFYLERPIDFSPPDIFLAGRFLNDKFVVGGAPGVTAGEGDQRTFGGDDRLRVADGVFVELCHGQIPVDIARRVHALILDAVAADEETFVLHEGD